MCHETHTCLHSSVQLQLLAADGTKMVSISPSAYSLKVDLNRTLATNEGLSPVQLANTQEKFMPIVYLLVVLVVCFRCTWLYKRKIVKEKMKNVDIWYCTSQTNSSAPGKKQLMQSKGTEDESDADNETLPAETHASTESARDKALMRSISMILAFQILATILSPCLGLEIIIHYAEVYPSAFAEPFTTVCLCLWVVALLLLLIIATCYTCIQRHRQNYWYLSLRGCCMKCLVCCVTYCVAPHLTALFSSIVDIVLTIGTIHFLAYVTSVSILFLLASLLRNWLLTFYIVVTNISCFIILLVALSEVAYLFLKVKLDKPAPGSKKWKCLMAVFHRTAVVFLFITLSAAMCIIYL